MVRETHVMKLAYAACQASKHDVSFSQKQLCFFDQISQVLTIRCRKKNGKYSKSIRRIRHSKDWNDIFNENQKWDAEITTEENGKSKCLISQVCLFQQKKFIQCMEFRCSRKMGNVEFG